MNTKLFLSIQNNNKKRIRKEKEEKQNKTKIKRIRKRKRKMKRSGYCQFAAGLSRALKDRLVCKKHTQGVLKKFLTKAQLPSKNGVEIAVSMETAT